MNKTEAVEREQVQKQPRLVHIHDTHCPPYVHFLCGASTARVTGEPSWHQEANCVVCLEMEKQVRFCSRCGVRLGHRS